MLIKEMERQNTYNFNTVQNLKNLGMMHKTMLVMGKILFEEGRRIEDIQSIFFDYAQSNNLNLLEEKYLKVRDIHGNIHIILEKFIEENSPSLTETFPVKVTLFNQSQSSIADLKHILSVQGYEFIIENG